MAKTVASDRVKAGAIRLQRYEDHLWLISPYNAKAVDRLKELHGRWQPTSKAWLFKWVQASLVMDLCVSFWGVEPEIEALETPYPEDKPKRGWSPSVKIETEPLSHVERASMFARDLAECLRHLTPEEKEEVLKPIFDTL